MSNFSNEIKQAMNQQKPVILNRAPMDDDPDDAIYASEDSGDSYFENLYWELKDHGYSDEQITEIMQMEQDKAMQELQSENF